MLSRNYRLAVAQKMKIKDLKVTVLLSLDVACLGSNSRMRLFPCGGAFYIVFFHALLTCHSLIGLLFWKQHPLAD